MGGGLLQLVAYGAQDAYLSGNPQITFWKGLFKRHTNFAMEPFRINFTGQPNWGTKQSAVIGRHADLLYSTYVEVVLPYYDNRGQVAAQQWNGGGGYTGRLGYNLIKYAEIEIGGQLIDRLYGEWLFLWDTLTMDTDQRAKLNAMVNLNAGTSQFALSNPAACGIGGRPANPNTLYIPLYFFFTKNPGAALPLIALQYHEVKINIQWNDPQLITGEFVKPNIGWLANPVQAAVYIDYIYLDVEERRRMAQQSHEYLIEQTQFNEDKGISSAQTRIDLTFNHPVKELVWVVQPTRYTNCGLALQQNSGAYILYPFNYSSAAVYEQRLQINGQDRMDARYGDYFSKVQPFQHHSGTTQPGIYTYSFAIRPEEHQPSGTCNFSRIDTATLVMTMSGGVTVDDGVNTWNVRVYAVNYNILRIMSGMAGLAYSN
jgi:hypothetical protein